MKKYIEREIITIEKVLDFIQCDHCKTNINETSTDHYYEVTKHHSDWGNDSIDSFEYKDFCSYECLEKDMRKYFVNASGSEEYEIDRVPKNNGNVLAFASGDYTQSVIHRYIL